MHTRISPTNTSAASLFGLLVRTDYYISLVYSLFVQYCVLCAAHGVTQVLSPPSTCDIVISFNMLFLISIKSFTSLHNLPAPYLKYNVRGKICN